MISITLSSNLTHIHLNSVRSVQDPCTKPTIQQIESLIFNFCDDYGLV